MFLKVLQKEKRAVLLYTVILFLIMAAVLFVSTLLSQSSTNRILRSEIEINETSLVDIEKSYIVNKLSGRVTDTLYIADSLLLSQSVHNDYAAVEKQWTSFSNRKEVYDQIRYIDKYGDERIRINYEVDGAVVVTKSELQNKKDRYYFINTMTLQKDQVYITELDLNIENNEIEQPINPMLRLATPLYGNNGVVEGMIILNYAAQDFLQQVGKIASTSRGEVYLLNLNGYWLYNGEDSEKEWAFMYEDRMDESFAHDFPEEWEKIGSTGSGMLNTDKGVFIYTHLDIIADTADPGEEVSLVCDSDVLYIVSYIQHDSENGALFSESIPQLILNVFVQYIAFYFLLLGSAVVLAAIIAINRAQKKEIKYFS